VTYVDKGGARFSLKAPNLPLGLGMLWGLLKFKKLSAKDKWAIIRFAIALRMGAKPKPNETAAQWLARHGQTKNSIHALWRPFCVAALNQELDTGDAALLYETLVRSLFGNADAAAIYFSKVPLGELFYPEAERFLKSIGSRAQLGAQVTALEFENGKITGFKVGDAPQVRTADLYISAMNWQALGALLEGKSPLAQTLKKIPSAGILNAHILSDKKWFAEPFVGFLDSPIQWVFDRSDLLPKEKQGTHFLYALTLSAPGPWETRGTKEISEMLRAELSSHFPQAAQSEFLREIVVKTLDATFAATPETEQLRPNAQNENGLMLAGDYTATALPATLESAALSARKLVDKIDHPPLP